jgi:hypothetical protein
MHVMGDGIDNLTLLIQGVQKEGKPSAHVVTCSIVTYMVVLPDLWQSIAHVHVAMWSSYLIYGKVLPTYM